MEKAWRRTTPSPPNGTEERLSTFQISAAQGKEETT
jgi:hypothetical protein